MLVGGGELHDRWSSLVGVAQPLSRGIQRFTGITQAMVDDAPPPERGAARARARSCAAACSSRTTRASTRACCARRSSAPRSTGPTRRCCARSRSRGGSRRCSAGAGSPRSPTRSASRSRACTARCPTPRRARACSARCSRGCARNARDGRRGGRAAAAAPARRGARPRPAAPSARADDAARPLRRCPKDPGVYVFRDADGRPLYVGKSVCLRTRARAHFTTPGELDRPGRARRLPGDATPSSARSCSRTG